MKHAELIARLEAAEVVTHALKVEFATHLYKHHETFKGLVNYDPELWIERNETPLNSMDAALALAERVLPGYWWLLRSDEEEAGFFANFGLDGTNPNMGAQCFPAFASTPALALCIAILKALEAKA